MAVNLAYITDIASEFASVDSSRVDRLVVIAQSQCAVGFWGDQRDIGVAYLVAHMLKIDALRGSGGVTAKSIKDLSLSYAATNAGVTDPSSLDLTSYGREFKRLRGQRARGPLVT